MCCSSEAFKEVVSAQRGMLYTPVGKALLKDLTMNQQLETVSAPLEEKYLALVTKGEWGGATTKASSFKASEQTPEKKKHKYPSRVAWFDNCKCGVCGKIGHPTYAHDDPVHHRKKCLESLPPRCSGKSNSNKSLDQRKKLCSLVKKDPSKLTEKVHKVLFDLIGDSDSEEDVEEQVHIADGAVDEFANDEDVADDDDSDAGVDATLTNLLKD